MTWQVLWERAVAKFLTDKLLEDYFAAHRREFDGSEIRASHILFRPAGRRDAAAIAKLVEEAAALRAEIEAGKLTFAEAAERYSAGPSREQGGDVGFFPWHGVMVEPFARGRLQPGKRTDQPARRHALRRTLDHGDRHETGHKNAGRTSVDQLQSPAAKAMFEKLAPTRTRKGQDRIH